MWLFKAVTACLAATILQQGVLTLDGLQRISRLDHEHMFVNLDSTSDDHLARLPDQPGAVSAMKELLNHAISSENAFSYWEYEDETFDDGSFSFAATTTPEFFQTYGLRVKEGTLDALGRRPAHDPEPVAVGSRVAELHPLGSRWSSTDFDHGMPIEYETVAVLEPRQNVPSLTDIGRGTSVDDRYFRALDADALDTFPALDMAIGSLVVHSADAQFPQSISQMSQELGLFEMNFATVDELVDEYFDQARYASSLRAALLFGFGGVATVLTVTDCLATARRNAPSFSARFISGASPGSISWRLLRRMWLLTAAISPLVILYSTWELGSGFPSLASLFLLALVDAACLGALRYRLSPAHLLRLSDR